MDCVTLLEEESVEGMDVGEESHAHEDEEYDEHVWLSPVNVMRIAESIRDTLMEADPANEAVYTENTGKFVSELEELDAQLRDIVANTTRTTIVFADRFPARYFTEAVSYTHLQTRWAGGSHSQSGTACGHGRRRTSRAPAAA